MGSKSCTQTSNDGAVACTSHTDLSAGAIAGIAVGSIVGLVLFVLLIYCLVRKLITLNNAPNGAGHHPRHHKHPGHHSRYRVGSAAPPMERARDAQSPPPKYEEATRDHPWLLNVGFSPSLPFLLFRFSSLFLFHRFAMCFYARKNITECSQNNYLAAWPAPTQRAEEALQVRRKSH